MGILLAAIGLIGAIACIIWLFLNLIIKRPFKIPSLALLACSILFVTGVAVTPTSEENTPVANEGISDKEETVLNKEAVHEEQAAALNEIEIDLPEEQSEQEPGLEQFPEPATGQLTVHFIDVGQGDSILIIAPSKAVLIDGGDRGSTALNYIRNQGIRSLDIVISTHPHADHIGGLINVLQNMPVGEVIDPAVAHTTKTFEDYLTVIDDKDIKFTEGRPGITRDLGGGAHMEILHPTEPSSANLNNSSIVARLTFGGISFLFTGDAEREAEAQLINRGHALGSNILKVGHHGSNSSTTQGFLSAVKPEVAVIMCGTGNSYGHPHDEVLARLDDANVKIYRTDLQSSIMITTDGQTYSINKDAYAYNRNQQPPPAAATTVDEEPAALLSDQGSFVGSRNSDKYHYPNCRHVSSIKPANIVWFETIEDAKTRGYVPCKGCNPPE